MKFPNLEQLAHRCANNTKESLSVSAQQARGISIEYMRILEQISDLQEAIIKLQKENNEVITVQYDTGEF